MNYLPQAGCYRRICHYNKPVPSVRTLTWCRSIIWPRTIHPSPRPTTILSRSSAILVAWWTECSNRCSPRSLGLRREAPARKIIKNKKWRKGRFDLIGYWLGNNNLVWWHYHRVSPYKMLYKLKSASHVSPTNYPHPFEHGACRSLTVMPWTTTYAMIIVDVLKLWLRLPKI